MRSAKVRNKGLNLGQGQGQPWSGSGEGSTRVVSVITTPRNYA
jgi:hypothetical protein